MKKKYVIIIAILAVIIVGLIVALVVTNLPKKEKAVDEPKEDVQKFEPLYLALDSDIVADIYERVNITPNNVFHKFDGSELNKENISDDKVNTAAYYYGNLEKKVEVMRPSIENEGHSGKLETSVMDSTVKKMFGDIDYNYANVYYIQDNVYLLRYDEKDNVFYRMSGFGGGNAPKNYSVITEVIEYEDRYEAKEMFIFGHEYPDGFEVKDYEGNRLNEGANYTQEEIDSMNSTIVGYSKEAMDKKILSAYEKQAYGYKHTFMKNSDGSYTWAKTEKLN